MNHPLLIAGLVTLAAPALSAQEQPSDTVKIIPAKEIIVRSTRLENDSICLAPVQDTSIFSGKKSEVIHLANADLPVLEKYARNLFSKVPGVFVYDTDGTGNRINILTRGLDAHRGWELNIRKDGILTNWDIYGYPASHYNVPMEAVDRIALVS